MNAGQVASAHRRPHKHRGSGGAPMRLAPRLQLTQCLRIFSTIAVVELFSTSPKTFTVPP
ncbi:hypothetical protein ACVWY1_002739 [Pseudomonas sp. TE6288]|nr:hypothetical protein [Pseudomonas hunanensis]